MSLLNQLEQLIQPSNFDSQQFHSLENQIQGYEFSLIQKGLFESSKVSAELVQEALQFYQYLYLGNILARQFNNNLDVYSKMTFLFSNLKNLSNQNVSLVSLQLMFLISNDDVKSYNAIYESLNEEERNHNDIKMVKKFQEFLNLGDYAQAQQAIQQLSPYHQVLLENIRASKKLDTSRIVDLCDDSLTIEEVYQLFGVQSDQDVKYLTDYTSDLFAKQIINWKIVQGSIFKRQKDLSQLDPEEIIGDMIGLVREIEEIYQFICKINQKRYSVELTEKFKSDSLYDQSQ